MGESLKYIKDVAVADLGAAEVLQPSVGAFESPAFAVSAPFAFVLETVVADVLSVGNGQFYVFPLRSRPERIGVVAPVGNGAPQMGTRAEALHFIAFSCFHRLRLLPKPREARKG